MNKPYTHQNERNNTGTKVLIRARIPFKTGVGGVALGFRATMDAQCIALNVRLLLRRADNKLCPKMAAPRSISRSVLTWAHAMRAEQELPRGFCNRCRRGKTYGRRYEEARGHARRPRNWISGRNPDPGRPHCHSRRWTARGPCRTSPLPAGASSPAGH